MIFWPKKKKTSSLLKMDIVDYYTDPFINKSLKAKTGYNLYTKKGPKDVKRKAMCASSFLSRERKPLRRAPFWGLFLGTPRLEMGLRRPFWAIGIFKEESLLRLLSFSWKKRLHVWILRKKGHAQFVLTQKISSNRIKVYRLWN